MLLSLNWLKEIVNIESSSAELEGILTMLGLEVESVNKLSSKYDKFIVAEITQAEKHPAADKLTICQVNTGNEQLQVICGAPNVGVGQKVVFGTIGAVVPNGAFIIEKRKIRGVESNGMICSPAELELGEDSSGIWTLPENAPTGASFADYYGLNDTIFEIGITPNRPDCLSHLGVARELAAYYSTKVNMPRVEMYDSSDATLTKVKVTILAPEKCYRYTGAVIKNCKIGPSPEWMQKRLLNIGMRPINIAVDVTNYVLLEMGQPLHAFDMAHIKDREIIVRTASDGEKFTTLDEKERTLDSEMLMICDTERPIAIGGIMGGLNSEISNATTEILLESAFFSPASVRKTSKKLALQSQSSYRFERGVDIENVPVALMRAASLIAEYAGGELIPGFVDAYPRKHAPILVTLDFDKTRKLIGINISDDEICHILNRLNFATEERDDSQAVFKVPSYRVDVSYDVDLIEDIARLYNYDNIAPNYKSIIDFEHQSTTPKLSVPPLRNKIRRFLVSNGFNEIITQNQVDPKSAEFFSENSVVLANPLGEELSRMRTSLIPSVMKVISNNIRKGTRAFRIFEIGKVFAYENSDNNFIEEISEKEHLAITLSGSPKPLQWAEQRDTVDFYDIKGIVEDFMSAVKIPNYSFTDFTSEPAFSPISLNIVVGKQQIGTFGKIDDKYLKNFDIEQVVFLAIINLETLYGKENTKYKYNKVTPYPGINRDLAFICDMTVKSTDVIDVISRNGGKFLVATDVFDQFIDKKLGDNKKSLAFALSFASMERTLTDDDIEPDISNICEAVENKFSGILRKS